MSNESIINLEVNEKNSLNKIYHISGFDCANCANQVEEYLNTQEEISSAKINYSTNKMYITYKTKSWTIYELVNIINKVETDNLEIYEEGKIFNRVNSRRWDKPKIISKCEEHDHDHNHDHDNENITAMNMRKMMITAMNISMIIAININMITKGKFAVPLLMLILEL